MVLGPRLRDAEALEFWSFARDHVLMYGPIIESYEGEHRAELPGGRIDLELIPISPLQRRVVSGVQAGTPMADLVELERSMASLVFAGPVEDVGFVDLTERLRDGGFLERLNGPSLQVWSRGGRVFGLPHDVHPLLLAYRADIVEDAGIDVGQIETWADFVRLLKPLQDPDGDGRADRYLLALGTADLNAIEAMFLQAGGLFDVDERPIVANEANEVMLSHLALWIAEGPGQIATQADEFTASGNRMRIEGRVLCALMPDWLTGIWRADLPQLSGRVKVMRLPAWERGGRRASTWGGTMLGIPTSARHPDAAWKVATDLYFSEELARALFTSTGIITPVIEHWPKAWYDEPNAYFSGQPIGRLYVDAAGDVPPRVNSVHNFAARQAVRDALAALRDHAEATGAADAESLRPVARRLLARVQAELEQRIARDAFSGGDGSPRAAPRVSP